MNDFQFEITVGSKSYKISGNVLFVKEGRVVHRWPLTDNQRNELIIRLISEKDVNIRTFLEEVS